MKRTVSAVLCVLLLAACCTAAAGNAGTSSDPLISESYINDTFIPKMLENGRSSIKSAMDAVYSQCVSKLYSAVSGGGSSAAPVSAPDGYTATSGGETVSLSAGETLSLASGSTLTFTSGAGKVKINSGAVIDVTAGKELSSGASVGKGVRCLCAENTKADFTASSAGKVSVCGFYKKTAGEPPVQSKLPFNDVSEEQWFYDAVSFVYGKGYMTGVSDSKFGVSDYTTRAVFVTALYRMAGSPEVNTESKFPDVSDSSLYYYKPVIWSNANGIVLGHDDGLFRPGDSITREQMAAIMHRFVKYAGYDVSNTDAAVFNSFPDKSSVNSYAEEPMKWATANRIINGMDGTLNPGGMAIRAQVAQIILNFYQYMA